MTGGVDAGARPASITAPELVEHFFRRQYGRLVAILTRRFGVQHIELVEDAVQGAFLGALDMRSGHWRRRPRRLCGSSSTGGWRRKS